MTILDFTKAKSNQYAKDITCMIDDVGLTVLCESLREFGYILDIKTNYEGVLEAASHVTKVGAPWRN